METKLVQGGTSPDEEEMLRQKEYIKNQKKKLKTK